MVLVGQGVFENVDAGLGEAEAVAIAHALYGLEGAAERLGGERDQNFRFIASDGARFVLKLSNSAEDPRVTDLQTRALLHLAASDLPTPRLRAGRDGQVQHLWTTRSGAECVVRLLSFLDGAPLSDRIADDAVLCSVGAALARLDDALRDFSHPADDHDLLWDLKRADKSLELLDAVADGESRRLAESGLRLFARAAVPKFGGLRTQVIHNDLNPHNVLVRPGRAEVTGILDLGDAVRGPLVNDVAVAAAYHVRSGPDPLGGVAALVAGYRAVSPLKSDEIDVLHPLIIGRLAMTVAITAWRARLYPDNTDYILRNAPAALVGLEQLLGLPQAEAIARIEAGPEVGL